MKSRWIRGERSGVEPLVRRGPVRGVVGAVLVAACAACSGGARHAAAPTTTTVSSPRPAVAVHVPGCAVVADTSTPGRGGDATGRLVPFAAVGVRVCKYESDSGPELLAGSGLVTDARAVAAIEDATNALPEISSAVADACQGGDVAPVRALFSDAARTLVVREDSMCGITNGAVWARPTALWNATIARIARQTAERPAIPLPTLSPTQPAPLGLAFVSLQSDGRCIWFPSFGERTIVLWPHGYTAKSWPLRVLDEGGRAVAHIGQKTQLVGRYTAMTSSLLAQVQPSETRSCFTIGQNVWVV